MDFCFFSANFIAIKVQEMKSRDANKQKIKNAHLLSAIKTILNVYTRLITKIANCYLIEYKRLFIEIIFVNQKVGRI